jgi:hypothetical protein
MGLPEGYLFSGEKPERELKCETPHRKEVLNKQSVGHIVTADLS